MSIAAQLAINLKLSSSEIVYSPESNGYALSVGVTVQLPITELVEVLLKFNAEHVAPRSSPQVESHHSHSLLASLPDASPYSFPESPSVYTPKAAAHATAKRAREPVSSEVPENDFSRIPVAVTRQDGMIMEYRERAKWRRESGKFFTDNSIEKQMNRMEKLNNGFKWFDELLVNEHFLHPTDMNWYHYPARANSMDAMFDSKPAKRLSADAPVFTPGSAFASTYVSEAGGDSVRQRAMSENLSSRQERAMSLTYLPPSALSVMHENNEAPVETAQPSTPSQELSSFWNKVVAAAASGSSVPELVREESRPAECKQM